jgi:drug/metabolite transporter (DMT)-like permease
MSERPPSTPPSRAKVIAAFAAVYLIWGSTYLAIRFAIETVPPFLMAAVRFLIAGAVLYLWVRMRGAQRPSRQNWLAALVVGGLLLFVGNGAVVWSEQHVPSGIVSLLVATVPLWVVLLEWAAPGGRRPSRGVVAGIAMGFAGLGLLVGPDALRGHGVIPIAGALVLVVASIAWAAGSVLSRKLRLPKAPLLATAMEMLAGGVLLSVLSLATAEWRDVSVAALSTTSLLALLYLIVFGSLIGFTAYIWLLGASSPARASTYAYVNPVVAVFLGWAIANEPISARTLLAAAIIIFAVVLITAGQHGQKAQDAQPRDPRPGRRAAPRSPRRVRAGSSG